MNARSAAALVLALTVACGGEEAPERPRGPFARGPAPIGAAPTTTTPIARTRHDYVPLTAVPQHMPSTATPTSGTSGAAPATTPHERDLGAELATAIGSPASCIDTATARTLHGHLSVQVSATVTPSGSVTRATASGGLPPAAIECVRARAVTAHLTPPIEGAPRTVSATLAFDVTTTDDVTSRQTPVWHQPGQVAEPGVVLPAIGAEGRPEGSVRPDSTLPAVGAQGRPEGSVRPDIVLPARGGPGTLWPSGAPPPPPTSTTTP